MKIVHDWLKEYLGDATPSSEKIEELLTFHAFEIEGVEIVGGETVIDVDVLPNRSSDCLCHRGIARELATLMNVSLVTDPLREKPVLNTIEELSVSIEDGSACRRFGLALMHDVKVGPSPEWLQKRLVALGQRSINNVVDATNYVMLSLGQPLHAYDASKWQQKDGVWQFGVRFARQGEKITTLTGDEYELDESVQLITDATTDIPAGIAGIKGGKYAEVDENTSTIILEAANFDPAVTRKASQFLKLQTDASKRFENEPSRELVPYALAEVTKLITEIAGGHTAGVQDVYPTKQESAQVSLSVARVNRLLGLSLTSEDIVDILRRIGAEVTKTEAGFTARGPFERTDITIEEDLIEEVGRVYGYNHVASIVPDAVPLTEINVRQYYGDQIRRVLIKLGFSEVITSSFQKKDEIRLQNALASDKGCLRSSLQKNMREVLDKNMPIVDLLGIREVRAFEIGTVFTKKNGGVTEHVSLAIGIRTRQDGYSPKDDTLLEEVIASLRDSLNIEVIPHIEQGVAEINMTELLAILPMPIAYEPFEKKPDVLYKPFSTYPHVARDIALWTTEGVTARDVEKILNEEAGELRVRTTLFDEFTKDGRTSYAFRLVFQSYEKTLTDAEVNAVMDRIYSAVSERGWEVR